ncbi:MAG: response regulator [Planctomycetes bacterium]|nr:response regulator [Planctomycetota bacterium]
MSKPKILIIEDDRPLSDVLAYNLRQSGFEVLVASDGQDGINQAVARLPSLVVLDVMLPVVNGLDVCRRLRSEPALKDLKIVMLTAKGDESDELIGFTLGADDYVTKPFSVKVLLERLKAVLRRGTGETGDEDVVVAHGVQLDRKRHRVTVRGRQISLTLNEFRILETLLRHAGRVFDRSQLIDAALGSDTMVLERTIDVHIRALRKKLGAAGPLIETVRGIGYRFRDTSDSEPSIA